MRFATTIVLAIVALGLGLYAYLDHSGVLKKVFGNEQSPVLVAPVPKAITAFTLQGDDGRRTLEIKEGRWQITSPITDAADPEWVNNALETFGALRASGFLPDTAGARRSDYGLSPDRATTLEIHLSDDKTLSYQLGHEGPSPGSTYLFPGEADDYRGAFVGLGDFSSLVEKPVSGIVDPVLARFSPEEIVALTFQAGDAAIELKRKAAAGSRWRLEAPLRQQADNDKVNALLTALTTLPISAVTLDPVALPVDTSPESKVVQLEFSTEKDPIKLTFTPHPSDPDLVQAHHSGRPLLYTMAKSSLAEIYPEDAESLRESRLLRVAAADVSSVTLTPEGGVPLQLEHSGTWLINHGEDKGTTLANPEQGERFLALLNETEVTQYLQTGPDKLALYGLDQPRYVMEMTGENLGPRQAERLVMRVGMPLGDSPRVFVTFDDTPIIAAVSKTFLTSLALAADPLKWKKLEVINVAFELMEEVELVRPGKPKLTLKVDLVHPDTKKRLQLEQDGKDRTADMDKHAAGELILELGNLHAGSWLTTAKESAIALAEPSLEITLKSRPASEEEEGETWTLIFAPVEARVPAFYFGQLEGTPRPEPFLISRELYDRLSGKDLILDSP